MYAPCRFKENLEKSLEMAKLFQQYADPNDSDLQQKYALTLERGQAYIVAAYPYSKDTQRSSEFGGLVKEMLAADTRLNDLQAQRKAYLREGGPYLDPSDIRAAVAQHVALCKEYQEKTDILFWSYMEAYLALPALCKKLPADVAPAQPTVSGALTISAVSGSQTQWSSSTLGARSPTDLSHGHTVAPNSSQQPGQCIFSISEPWNAVDMPGGGPASVGWIELSEMSLTYFSQSYYGGMYYGTWTDGKDIIVKTTLTFHGKNLAALFHKVNIYRFLQKLQGDIIPLYYNHGYVSLNGSRVAVLVIEHIPGDVVPMSDEMDLRPELANLTPSARVYRLYLRREDSLVRQLLVYARLCASVPENNAGINDMYRSMVDCTSEYCAVAYSLDRALAVGGVFENDIWHIFSAKSELAKEVRHLRLLPTSQQLESEPYARIGSCRKAITQYEVAYQARINIVWQTYITLRQNLLTGLNSAFSVYAGGTPPRAGNLLVTFAANHDAQMKVSSHATNSALYVHEFVRDDSFITRAIERWEEFGWRRIVEKATVDNAAVMVNVRELGQEMELTADIISFFGPRLDFLISLVAPDIHDIQYMLGSPTSGPDAYYMARRLTSLGTDIDAILEVKCRFSKRPCVSHPADDQIAANFAANQDYLNSMFGDNRNTSHGLNVLHALTQVTHYITTNSKSYGHAFIFSADGIIYVRRYKDGRIYTSELIPYNSTRPYPLVFLASAIHERIDDRQPVKVPINYDNAWEYTANDGQDNRN